MTWKSTLGLGQFRVTPTIVVVVVIVIEALNWLHRVIDYDYDNRCADNDNEGGVARG